MLVMLPFNVALIALPHRTAFDLPAERLPSDMAVRVSIKSSTSPEIAIEI